MAALSSSSNEQPWWNVLPANADLAESPVWDAGDAMLWWVGSSAVHALIREWTRRGVPARHRSSRSPCAPAAGCSWRCATVSMPATGVCQRRTARPGPSGPSLQRHARSAGAVLGGQPAFAGDRADRRPYRLDPDGQCARTADGIYAPTERLSPDGTAGYHADSRQQVVWRFDCDRETGTWLTGGFTLEPRPRSGWCDRGCRGLLLADAWAAGGSSATIRWAESTGSSSCQSRHPPRRLRGCRWPHPFHNHCRYGLDVGAGDAAVGR